VLTDVQRERYLRHILLREIGAQGQQKLLSSKVLIVGIGGIGAPVLQYLCSAGVGTIGVIDHDIVDLSNLQRQVIFAQNDIGRPKVLAAQEFCHRLNGEVSVISYNERLTDTNAVQLFTDYDLVIEGVDNFNTRFVINDAAIATATPFLSAAIGQFEGQLSLYAPHAGDWPCYRCFVPEAPPLDAQVNCLEEGVVGALTGVIGTLAAMEAIKALVLFGESLVGQLLIYRGLQGTMRRIKLPRDLRCESCAGIIRPVCG